MINFIVQVARRSEVKKKICLLSSWCSFTLFQDSNLAYLVLNRNSRSGYQSIHGNFKIPGNGSYAIENCGKDCHVVAEIADAVNHPPYEENTLITDDSQLPPEVFKE